MVENTIHANGLCTRDCPHDDPDEGQVALCRAWLRRWAAPRRTVNRKTGSYVLKHRVERSVGEYVTNGAFIRAAELEGYRIVATDYDSPNAFFNIAPSTDDRSGIGPSLFRR